MLDYYKVLGVAPDADAAALRRAYRAQAKRRHPDAHPHGSAAQGVELQRRFIELAQAYQTLADPARRQVYDRQRHRHPAAGAAAQAAADSAAPGRSRPTRRSAAGASGRPASGTSAGTTAGAARPRAAGHREAAGDRAAPHAASADLDRADLETLLREFSTLLREFGLDLRHPLEEVLEALLDWAREVYRGVLGEQGSPAAGPAPGRQAATGAGPSTAARPERNASPAGTAQARVHTAPQRPRRTAGPSSAEIEAELAAIKAAVRQGRKAGAPVRRPEIEAELAAIKRRRRKPRTGPPKA